ncbi:hypothetical protein H1C71_035021 [Ictidomys tridecemlineatus]|nr:hypothetical protein H1C71_035021 [Ictidomys tridecemlineatus]
MSTCPQPHWGSGEHRGALTLEMNTRRPSPQNTHPPTHLSIRPSIGPSSKSCRCSLLVLGWEEPGHADSQPGSGKVCGVKGLDRFTGWWQTPLRAEVWWVALLTFLMRFLRTVALSEQLGHSV